MARHVEVGSAIGEAWRVGDVNSGDRYLSSLAVAEWQRLAQSLDAVEHSGSRCSGNAYLFGVRVELVALGIAYCLVNTKNNGCAALRLLAYSRADACSLLDVCGKHVGVALHVLTVGQQADNGIGVERERSACVGNDMLWKWDNVEVRSLSHCGFGQEESHCGDSSCQ